MNRENVCMRRLVWWLKVRSFLDRIDYNFGWICADVACVAARCCVHVMHKVKLMLVGALIRSKKRKPHRVLLPCGLFKAVLIYQLTFAILP